MLPPYAICQYNQGDANRNKPNKKPLQLNILFLFVESEKKVRFLHMADVPWMFAVYFSFFSSLVFFPCPRIQLIGRMFPHYYFISYRILRQNFRLVVVVVVAWLLWLWHNIDTISIFIVLICHLCTWVEENREYEEAMKGLLFRFWFWMCYVYAAMTVKLGGGNAKAHVVAPYRAYHVFWWWWRDWRTTTKNPRRYKCEYLLNV